MRSSLLIAICLGIAVVYSIFHPGLRDAAAVRRESPARYFILRWLHAAVWVLMAAALWVGWNSVAGRVFAFAALAGYTVFLVTFLRRGRRSDG